MDTAALAAMNMLHDIASQQGGGSIIEGFGFSIFKAVVGQVVARRFLGADQRTVEVAVSRMTEIVTPLLEHLDTLDERVATLAEQAMIDPSFQTFAGNVLDAAADTSDEVKHRLLRRILQDRLSAPPESTLVISQRLAVMALRDMNRRHINVIGLKTFAWAAFEHIGRSPRFGNADEENRILAVTEALLKDNLPKYDAEKAPTLDEMNVLQALGLVQRAQERDYHFGGPPASSVQQFFTQRGLSVEELPRCPNLSLLDRCCRPMDGSHLRESFTVPALDAYLLTPAGAVLGATVVKERSEINIDLAQLNEND